MFDFSTKAYRKEAWLFLETVWKGLDYLCQQVGKEETERAAKSGKNFTYIDFGDQLGDAMVCNCFLWYTSALHNFIQVFQKAFSPAEDLKHEFANVITWRNKVSAHTSWVWPRGDNAAPQNMSILLFPEFNFKFDGHFEVGGDRLESEGGRPVGRLAVGTCSHTRAVEGDCEQVHVRPVTDKAETYLGYELCLTTAETRAICYSQDAQ